MLALIAFSLLARRSAGALAESAAFDYFMRSVMLYDVAILITPRYLRLIFFFAAALPRVQDVCVVCLMLQKRLLAREVVATPPAVATLWQASIVFADYITDALFFRARVFGHFASRAVFLAFLFCLFFLLRSAASPAFNISRPPAVNAMRL